MIFFISIRIVTYRKLHFRGLVRQNIQNRYKTNGDPFIRSSDFGVSFWFYGTTPGFVSFVGFFELSSPPRFFPTVKKITRKSDEKKKNPRPDARTAKKI